MEGERTEAKRKPAVRARAAQLDGGVVGARMAAAAAEGNKRAVQERGTEGRKMQRTLLVERGEAVAKRRRLWADHRVMEDRTARMTTSHVEVRCGDTHADARLLYLTHASCMSHISRACHAVRAILLCGSKRPHYLAYGAVRSIQVKSSQAGAGSAASSPCDAAS